MIKVFALRLKQVEQFQFDNLLQFSDLAKRKRILGFVKSEDKLRTLMGDLLVRAIIKDHLRIPNHQIIFDYTDHGKPILKNHPDFHYNLSHSGQWIVCACGNAPVGIDVEQVKPIECVKMARHMFSAEESKDLESKDEVERLNYFYAIWTIKESYLKAKGVGLSEPLDAFSIKVSEDGIIHISGQDGFFFKQYVVEHNYIISICSCVNDFPSKIEEVKHIWIEHALSS